MQADTTSTAAQEASPPPVHGAEEVPGAGTPAGSRPKRYYFLDWLRVAAILFVFANHSLRMVVGKDPAPHHEAGSVLASGVVWFIRMWVMPLIFLVSGAAAKLSTDVRSSQEFLRERFRRLVIPFFFGVIALVIPMTYLADAHQARDRLPFPAFYLHSLIDFSAGWSPATFRTWASHLWFLAYLFIYSVFALAFLPLLRAAPGRRLIRTVATISVRPGGLFIFALPIGLVHLLTRIAYPRYCDWADFAYWLLIYVFGALLISDPRIFPAIAKQRLMALLSGLLCWAAMLALHLSGRVVGSEVVMAPVYSLWHIVFLLVGSLNTWSWLLFFVGVSMQYLDFGGRAHRYANEAVLPFYILHLPVLTLLSLWLIPWNRGVAVTFAALSVSALLATLGIYEVGVRRANVSRFLLGMRPAVQALRPTLRVPSRHGTPHTGETHDRGASVE